MITASSRRADHVSLGLLGVTSLATAAVYRTLPLRMATHFDWHGQPNSWLPRAVAATSLPALAALFFVGARVALPRLRGSAAGLSWTVTATVAFLCSLHVFVVGYARDPGFDVGRATCIACGAFFVALGLLMPRLRQNLLLGVRTPWTARSPEVWARTQRVAGAAFCAGGLLIATVAALAPALALPVLLATSLAIGVGSALFSWRIAT